MKSIFGYDVPDLPAKRKHVRTPSSRLQHYNYTREWKKRNRDRVKCSARERRRKVIDHYGGKCACCGEAEIDFLTLDHVDGDGADHRRQLGNKKIYHWLRKRGYPTDFRLRVLCWNCNCARGKYGVCPHERKRNQ